MRVLLLTDIHGDIENVRKIVDREEFDVLLCAGDLSDVNEFGEEYGENLRRVLDELDIEGKFVKAVPGNMDPEKECVKALMDRRMNIHKRIAAFSGVEAVGFGGGITPFGTPFEPSGAEIKTALETLYDRMSADKKIGVIHQPPEDSELDKVDEGHVGSPEVRELLEETDFDLVLTGHIHESSGKDFINNTLVVNPGPVLEGCYGIVDLDKEDLDVEFKRV